MLGQLFPRHECAKRKLSTNDNLSFKSNKLKKKKFGGKEEEGEEIKRLKRRSQGTNHPRP